ncbi:AAEL017180-PA [Aedes aegypti]|uniref:AAEL017180-PA n=1 Tax=Aedes aegypti TaxID=7159 RepID=J9HSM6_AEDAE|nr:AAEL017180-PA [Aedes aegypti]
MSTIRKSVSQRCFNYLSIFFFTYFSNLLSSFISVVFVLFFFSRSFISISIHHYSFIFSVRNISHCDQDLIYCSISRVLYLVHVVLPYHY